jgi:sulfur-carrier protein
MAVLRLFASAREAAGTGSDVVDGTTVGEVLDLAQVLGTCRVWVNGDAADRSAAVAPTDEVAVLPPVSGGCQ